MGYLRIKARRCWTRHKRAYGCVLLALLPLVIVVHMLVISSYGPGHREDESSPDCSKFIYSESTRYHPPFDLERIGKKFAVENTTLCDAGFPFHNFIKLDSQTVLDFAVVMGVTLEGNYLELAVEAISGVQSHLPDREIIVYGLTDFPPLTVDKINQLCGATYKRLRDLPQAELVTRIKSYGFKAVIIHEELRTYSGVLWLDASARVTSDDFKDVLNDVIRTDGVMTLTSTGHSVYSATHPQTYQYIPTDVVKMAEVTQHECGAIFLYRTQAVYTNLLKWWLLCSLDRDCISPTERIKCNDVYSNEPDYYANCHRYDQSVLNVLMANAYNFNDGLYVNKKKLVNITRWATGGGNVRVCVEDEEPTWKRVAKVFRKKPWELVKRGIHDVLIING